MDIFDRKKQGGVFGMCYAHKNIHYHDPKGSVFYIPNQGFLKSHFWESHPVSPILGILLYPISGNHIPHTGIYYIPLQGVISQMWELEISHFRELHPKYGIYKPLGLLQDTHFVCTNCKSCQGIPLKPLVYQNWYMQNTSFGTRIPEMVYTNFGKIPILVYEK